jgi:prevent-host-death family protein
MAIKSYWTNLSARNNPIARRINAAETNAHLSEFLARAAYSGERFLIERHGKPIAALVSVAELGCLEKSQTVAGQPLGALALVGAWSDLDEAAIDEFISAVYTQRTED